MFRYNRGEEKQIVKQLDILFESSFEPYIKKTMACNRRMLMNTKTRAFFYIVDEEYVYFENDKGDSIVYCDNCNYTVKVDSKMISLPEDRYVRNANGIIFQRTSNIASLVSKILNHFSPLIITPTYYFNDFSLN